VKIENIRNGAELTRHDTTVILAAVREQKYEFHILP
jgi:hypothetical protein